MAITIKGAELPPWLLFVFSLPTRRASQRVAVWRKLQRLGCVSLGNSGYLLPNDSSNRERFEWLATAIRGYGGNASVVEVQSIDNFSGSQIVDRFVKARTQDYQELLRELRRNSPVSSANRSVARIGRLRQRFQDVLAIDFFHSPLRERVQELLDHLQNDGQSSPASLEAGEVARKNYRGRVWITRPRPGVDRVTSAWLIRRFIDPKARFLFAMKNQLPRKAVPYDMYQGGFGHRGDDCRPGNSGTRDPTGSGPLLFTSLSSRIRSVFAKENKHAEKHPLGFRSNSSGPDYLDSSRRFFECLRGSL